MKANKLPKPRRFCNVAAVLFSFRKNKTDKSTERFPLLLVRFRNGA